MTIKYNKKGLNIQPSSLIMGLLMFSLFVTGCVLVFSNHIDNYELNTTTKTFDANFSEVYNITDDIYDIAQDSKNKTLNAEIEGEDQSIDSIIKGAYSALRLVGNAFVLPGKIIDAVSQAIGIPSFIVKTAKTVILIGVIFGVIALLFKVSKT